MIFIPSQRTYVEAAILVAVLSCLSVITLWRLAYHIHAKSHLRRMFFHLHILAVILFQIPYWACETLKSGGHQAFGISFVFQIFSESMNFVSITLAIFLWTGVLSAGLVSVGTSTLKKNWKSMHFLAALNLVQMIYTFVTCILILKYGGMERIQVYNYIQTSAPFKTLQWIFLICELILAISVIIVGIQLQCRLISSQMDENLKKKSLIQINIATITVVLTIFLQLILTSPILWSGMTAWQGLDFTAYLAFGYSLPCIVNCCNFLYLLRRNEARCVERVAMTLSPYAFDRNNFASPCSTYSAYAQTTAVASPVPTQNNGSHCILSGILLKPHPKPTSNNATNITIEISGCYGIETYSFDIRNQT